MENPFYLKQLPIDGPFCNRIKELEELAEFSRSKNNVVVHSPRRYGKTSLLRRVQAVLAAEDAITVYADFFGVGSVDDVAERMAEAVFRVTRPREAVWKKALRFITSYRPILRPSTDGSIEVSVEAAGGQVGLPLLKSTLEELGRFIDSSGALVSIVLDEFQEIITLKESLRIEAVMRTEMQQHQASYIFVGSQRRLLRNIFNENHRPFFRSAFEYELKPLPMDELAGFIRDMVQANGLKCEWEPCEFMARSVGAFPYYAQKLAYFVFERSREAGEVTMEKAVVGIRDMLSNEKAAFESMLQGIPSQQRMFLRALAKEPTAQPFARAYSRRHNLGSISALQHALKQLDTLDLIEQKESTWAIVDPVFRLWLAGGGRDGVC